MRIFVTGATGFIGSAVVLELLGAGHEVLGLTRSDDGAAALAAAGAEAHRGSLDDLESLRRGAAASGGVIHTAYNHDFSDMAGAAELDRAAIEAMGDVLASDGRPMVVSGGVALLRPGSVVKETDELPSSPRPHPRVSEDTADALASRIRSSTVRLAPSVHGAGDHGFVPRLIAIARETGVSAYAGDGSNRWPAVHRLDAARLFRLALERGTAGSKYHGVAEEGVCAREIAEAIGRHVNVPVVSKSPEEALEHFGWIGRFFALDCPASNALTQAQLGWRPEQPGLIADLDQGHYFESEALLKLS